MVPSDKCPTVPTIVRQHSDSSSDSPTADNPTAVRQVSDSSDKCPTVPTVPTARAQSAFAWFVVGSTGIVIRFGGVCYPIRITVYHDVFATVFRMYQDPECISSN